MEIEQMMINHMIRLMEEKISRKEAEADAFSEIAGADDDMIDSFAQIETDAKVDAELQRLMAELGAAATDDAK